MGVFVLATSDLWAAGFWKGIGDESGTAGNWSNGHSFMDDDNFYFRDSKMIGTDARRIMRLTANVDNTNGQKVFFQCGTEAEPFVVDDDGKNSVIKLKGNIYVGHSTNADNTNADKADDAGYYGSAVLNGGTWTCGQLYVGDVVNGLEYTGYLRLNGASLTAIGQSGNDFANGKIIVDNGTLSFTGGDLFVGKNSGSAELVINGGIVSVAKWMKTDGNGKGTISLNGGTLQTYHIHEQSGSTTVNFNGGILKATDDYASYGGLIHGNVDVNVNAGGGCIDNGGYNIVISAPLDGSNGLTFTGTGTTTLGGKVSYVGKTSVTPGTTLAIANSEAMANILNNGLVVAGIPSEGDTILTYTEDLTGTDLSKVTCAIAPGTVFGIGGEGNTAIVVKSVGQLLDNCWTGSANDGDLSNAANWSGDVPTTGNANIFSTAPVTLTKGATFAPTSITFLEGSAAVTIDGDFTTLTAIINSSSVKQTFSGKVDFGSRDINVVQCGAYDDSSKSVTGGFVVFAGLVTGKNITNHTVFTGNYELTTDEKINFKTSGSSRGIVNANSTLRVKKTDQIQELYIMSGARFHVENASHGWNYWDDTINGNQNHRLWYRSAGMFIADSYEFTGNGRMWLGGYLKKDGDDVANANAVLKIGTLKISSNGAIILHGYGDKGDALTTYIGEGGVNIESGKTGYYWVENNKHASTLRPWDSNFTFGKGAGSDYDLRIGNSCFTFHTDDESGAAKEITLDARIKTDYESSSLAVKGGGVLKVTSASPLMTGSTVVKDAATLMFGPDAGFGKSGTAGAITLGAGTTLALTAVSREFLPLVNVLNLPMGENAVATIRIDGKRLRSGNNIIATVGNEATTANVKLDVDSSAIDGRRAKLRVVSADDGENKLELNIEPEGFKVIVR